MMELSERINAFARLGEKLRNLPEEEFFAWAKKAELENKWFTYENVKLAFSNIYENLKEDKLNSWLKKYHFSGSEKKVGVVMAGNIPLVGFHDFMCVLLSGHILYAKLSTQDAHLLKNVASLLIDIEPRLGGRINFAERLNAMDAMIATGSDNSARYFEYYFSKIPNIIRKNRTSVGVITGQESDEELSLLGKDILQYFGLGCRNVSKVYVPEDYQFDRFYQAIENYQEVIHHNKYLNNYEYNKSIYLVNDRKHKDNGFLLITEDQNLVSPISVLFYERYNSLDNVQQRIESDREKIQVIVSSKGTFPGSIPFGKAQSPELEDFADNVDTLDFLAKL